MKIVYVSLPDRHVDGATLFKHIACLATSLPQLLDSHPSPAWAFCGAWSRGIRPGSGESIFVVLSDLCLCWGMIGKPEMHFWGPYDLANKLACIVTTTPE